MHAVVKVDNIKLHLVQNQLNFLQQHRVGKETRSSQSGNESLPGESLLDLGIVVPRDGVANEQDAGQICFVCVGNPDVAPLDRLVCRLCRCLVSCEEANGKNR